MDSGLDSYGRSELHYAANDSDIAKTESLIRGGVDVSLSDKNGWTPLHFAAQSSSVEIAQMLLDAGARVDATDSHGNTPLFRATFESRGNGDMIELLRARGADPIVPNQSGVTQVDLARTIANFDVAQFYEDLSI